jgi:hypothetical protein
MSRGWRASQPLSRKCRRRTLGNCRNLGTHLAGDPSSNQQRDAGRHLASNVTLGGSSTCRTGRRQGLGEHGTVGERQFASVLSNPIVLPKATGVPMLRSDSRRLVLTKLDRLAKRPRVTLTVSLVLLIPVPIDQSQPGPGEGVRAFFVTPAGVAPPPPPILPPAAGARVVRRAPAAPRPATEVLRTDRHPREDRDGGGTGPRFRGRRFPGGVGQGIVAGVPAEEPPRRWFASATASSRPGPRELRRVRGCWALRSRWLSR